MSFSASQAQVLARTVPLFRSLSPDDVSKIFAHGNTLRMGKGQVVFYQGATGNTMYVVLGGSVALYEGQKPLALLRTGDMFGEMAFINNEPRSATAVAAEDCHLFMLSETTFQKLLTKRVSIQILLNIIGTLSHRLRETNTRYAKLQNEIAPPT